jgi:hypothetical protein
MGSVSHEKYFLTDKEWVNLQPGCVEGKFPEQYIKRCLSLVFVPSEDIFRNLTKSMGKTDPLRTILREDKRLRTVEHINPYFEYLMGLNKDFAFADAEFLQDLRLPENERRKSFKLSILSTRNEPIKRHALIIGQDNNHFFLYHVDFETREIHFYDSCSMCANNDRGTPNTTLLEYLNSLEQDGPRADFTFHIEPCPQQYDKANDLGDFAGCGVFICMFAKIITGGGSVAFVNPKNVSAYRREIVWRIWSQRVNPIQRD